MTSPTQEPNPLSSHIYTHGIGQAAAKLKAQDTLAPGGQDTISSAASIPTWGRPILRSAQPQAPPDALVSLAAAFAAIFAAESNSAKSSFFQVSQDQELSNIQSAQVMTSTVNAVNKQQEVYNEYKKIEKKADNPVLKYLGWIILALTIVLMIATLISGFATGLSSDTLVPEEIEMADMSTTLATTGGDEEPAILTPELENAMQMTTVDSTGASTTSSSTTTTQAAGQAGTQAERSTVTKLLVYLGRFLGASAGASPMLAQGIVSLKLVPVYNSLAATQRGTGAAVASQSMQQSIFSFLQKCSERDQSVASNEAGAGADVTNAYNKITGLYEQIAQQSKQGLI